MVVNNLRDIESDKLAGKKTLAVKFGHQFTCYEFTLLLIINCFCYIWLALKWANYSLIIAAILIAIPSIYLIIKIFNFDHIDLNIILERTAQLSFFNSIIFFTLNVL